MFYDILTLRQGLSPRISTWGQLIKNRLGGPKTIPPKDVENFSRFYAHQFWLLRGVGSNLSLLILYFVSICTSSL